MPRQVALFDLPDPEWIDLLRQEVGKGRTITAVADSIGMKRCSLSLLLSGGYPARLDKVSSKYAAKVVALYKDQVLCPHLNSGISREACRAFAGAPMSISDPNKLRHHRACARCPLNPLLPTNQNEVTNAV